jgi:HSP20 family protein
VSECASQIAGIRVARDAQYSDMLEDIMARDSSQRGGVERQGTNQRSVRGGGSRAAPGPVVTSATTKSTSPDQERQITTGREGGQQSRRSGLTPQRGYGLVNLGDPMSLMQRMAEDLDRLFDQFGFGLGFGPQRGTTVPGLRQPGLWRGLESAWSPQVEVFRRGDELVVRADLPGLNRDDVQVDVDNDVLTIAGERKQEKEESREGVYRTERSYGQFYRAIPLPENVDASKVKASFNDGVLEVTAPLPKEEQRRSTRITIE